MSFRVAFPWLVASWSVCSLAQVKTPQDYQQQLSCSSSQSQQLLNAAIKPDPRDNVWVLEVLDAMGLNRYCNELHAGYYANFLERQAANDILKEPIPQLATVHDAIAWERTIESDRADRHDGVTTDRNHLHDRMLTRAFRMQPWLPRAEDVELIRMSAGMQMILPGVWLNSGRPELPIIMPLLSLAFVNQATRTITWEAHYLLARTTRDGPLDKMFTCMVDGRDGPRFTINRVTVPPGGVVHVACSSASTDWKRGELDAVWLNRLLHEEKQWLLQGPAPEGDTFVYRDTIMRLSNPRSAAQANEMIRSLSCNQRMNCVELKAAVQGSQIYQLIVVGLPSALAGAVLVWLLSWGSRARMPGVAKGLIGTVAAVSVLGLMLLFTWGAALGMGAIKLLFAGLQVAGGLIAGMLLVWIWSNRLRAATDD